VASPMEYGATAMADCLTYIWNFKTFRTLFNAIMGASTSPPIYLPL
jgi:hypothetical protein